MHLLTIGGQKSMITINLKQMGSLLDFKKLLFLLFLFKYQRNNTLIVIKFKQIIIWAK